MGACDPKAQVIRHLSYAYGVLEVIAFFPDFKLRACPSDPSYSLAITSGGVGAAAVAAPRLPSPPKESSIEALADLNPAEKDDVRRGFAGVAPVA